MWCSGTGILRLDSPRHGAGSGLGFIAGPCCAVRARANSARHTMPVKGAVGSVLGVGVMPHFLETDALRVTCG